MFYRKDADLSSFNKIIFAFFLFFSFKLGFAEGVQCVFVPFL